MQTRDFRQYTLCHCTDLRNRYRALLTAAERAKQTDINCSPGNINMIKAILHAGLSKCGSSALQASLSRNPVPAPDLDDKNSFYYAAIERNGTLLHGKRMAETTQYTPNGYYACASAKNLINLSPASVSTLAHSISDICRTHGTIIMSNEGWWKYADLFHEGRFLQRLDLNATIVIYIRPPAEWINSAWWQWGAWQSTSFDDWLNKNIYRACWHRKISHWHGMENVGKLAVRLLPADIVRDFCGVAGIPAITSRNINKSLPATVLRLFQKQKQLRMGPHTGSIDFVLERHLKMPGEPAPWILATDAIEKIVNFTRDSNNNLLELLDEKSADIMKADRRWWNADAYNGKTCETPEPVSLAPEKLEKLAAEIIPAISLLERENHELNHRLHASRIMPDTQRERPKPFKFSYTGQLETSVARAFLFLHELDQENRAMHMECYQQGIDIR